MPVANFEDFEDYCASQSIELFPSLTKLTLSLADHPSVAYNPFPLTAAVTSAGTLLRERRIASLASGALKIDHRILRSGSAALALANIINGSIEPDYDYGEAAFDCNTDRSLDTCRTAEYGFARTVVDIAQNSNPNCHIIGNGRPVLLRKAKPNGVPSTLALRDINIDGVPYPAGSIVRLELYTDDRFIHSATNGVESIGLESVKNVGFIRLSAFALRGKERRRFREATTDDYNGNPLPPLRLDEIIRATESVYTPNSSV